MPPFEEFDLPEPADGETLIFDIEEPDPRRVMGADTMPLEDAPPSQPAPIEDVRQPRRKAIRSPCACAAHRRRLRKARQAGIAQRQAAIRRRPHRRWMPTACRCRGGWTRSMWMPRASRLWRIRAPPNPHRPARRRRQAARLHRLQKEYRELTCPPRLGRLCRCPPGDRAARRREAKPQRRARMRSIGGGRSVAGCAWRSRGCSCWW